MHFNRKAWGVLTLVLIVGATLAAGCSEDDDDNPADPGEPHFSEEAAALAGLATAEGIDGVIDEVPAWAAGDLSEGFGGFEGLLRAGAGAPEDTATYDEDLDAWVLRDTIMTVDGGDSTYIVGYLAAQFLTKGVPHEDRSTWDEIDATLSVDVFNHDEDSPAGGIDSETTLNLDFALDITPGPKGPYDVHGTGTSSGSITTTLPTTDEIPEYTYAFDLTGIDVESCPEGTVVVTMDDYLFTATYDASSDVDWVLTHEGESVDSGTYACGLED